MFFSVRKPLSNHHCIISRRMNNVCGTPSSIRWAYVGTCYKYTVTASDISYRFTNIKINLDTDYTVLCYWWNDILNFRGVDVHCHDACPYTRYLEWCSIYMRQRLQQTIRHVRELEIDCSWESSIGILRLVWLVWFLEVLLFVFDDFSSYSLGQLHCGYCLIVTIHRSMK